MIPTKTYPLSAIIGKEKDEYECGYAQGCEEGKERIAELEAQLKHCEGHAAELEAEVKALREYGVGLVNFLEEILYAISIDKNVNARIRAAAATLEQRIKTAKEGK